MGLWCWLSFRRDGELPFAWFSRSSASRSLFCNASSSCACVVTACFLACYQLESGTENLKDALLVYSLIQCLETAVEVEQRVELVHEVAGNGAASVRTRGSYASG